VFFGYICLGEFHNGNLKCH